MSFLYLLRRGLDQLGSQCSGLSIRPATFAVATACFCWLSPVVAQDLKGDVPKAAQKVDRMGIDLADRQIIVSSDAALRLVNDFSFDMDIRFSSLDSGNFFQLNDNWDENGFYFQIYEEHLVLAFGDQGGLSQAKSSNDLLETGRWYRLSGIKDGTVARLFVDGQEVVRGDVEADIIDSDADLVIGPTGYSPAVEIARFRFWPEPVKVDSDNAFGIAENNDGLPPPLIHHEFEEGQAVQVTDLASGWYDGRIEASPEKVVHALDLSESDNAVVVEQLKMPRGGRDFALKLDVMFDDLYSGLIAHAANEQGAFFRIEYDEERLQFTLSDGREEATIVSPEGPLEIDEWMTIAILYEDGVASLLINGIRVASFEVPGGLDGGPMRLAIGEGYKAAAFHVGAVKVWGRSLTDREGRASLLAEIDHGDPDLLLALGPWERRPDHHGRLEGFGPKGTLLGDPDKAWTEMAPLSQGGGIASAD